MSNDKQQPAGPGWNHRFGRLDAVYELVDTTDDEMYYPIGIFLSLEEAVSAVESRDRPWNLSDQAYDCDGARIEIRKRLIGLHWHRFETVKTWEWRVDYSDESNERFELVKPTPDQAETPL